MLLVNIVNHAYQWRICFEWHKGNAYEVEIVDYHCGETMREMKNIQPLHPGEVLLEEFLKPMHLSQNRLAIAIRVPARRINEIVLGRRRITADTALRLARYFNMTPDFWLGLQMDFDIESARDALGNRLEIEIQPMQERH
mgnify:CR=1 FL=1